MLQYVFLTFRQQRGRSFLTGGGFLLAACALILLSATTQTATLKANQIISQNWRPVYDLVVLPHNVKVNAGQPVPADLLEGYSGGISLQQYTQIKQMPGVEIAAPIAFIGYVQLPSPSIQFASKSLSGGYYRVDWTLTSFNGYHHIVERQVSFMYAMLNNCSAVNNESSTLAELAKQNIELGGCGPTIGEQPSDFTFPSIDTGTFLLAAIDPAEEDQLVHLSQSITGGRMLAAQDAIKLDSANPSVRMPDGTTVPGYDLPLLFDQQLPGQIALHATFSRVTTQQIDPQQVLDRGGFQYLAQFPGQQVLFNQNVPIVQNDPQRFSNAVLIWNGHSWQTLRFTIAGSNLNFLYAPSSLTYQPITGPDGQPAYTLVPSSVQSPEAALGSLHLQEAESAPVAEQGPEVAFRTLAPLHIAQNSQTGAPSAYYFAKTVGEFNGVTLSGQFSDALNWLPETTYAAPPVILRYDAQGHPIPPTNLLPTTNPAGMILQPPLALTTLSAAAQLKGDRLISAIRVRVSGVNAVNDASWQRIERIAQLIQQSTGLQVLITLGSSPHPTLVYIPGIRQGQDGSVRTIAPVGWVEERWITIGAGLVYLNQSRTTQQLLLSIALLVCLGYLAVTLSSLVAVQRKEFAILNALGWRPWYPAELFVLQSMLLALAGGIVGIGLAVLVMMLIGAFPPWTVVLWTLPIMLLLALLSSLYPLWQLWHILPAEVLRAGTSVSREQAGTVSRDARVPGISHLSIGSGLALRNLFRSRGRTLIALTSLFLSAILLTVMANGILTFRQTLQGTLLGNYVLLQTAIPQLAGAIVAIVLTFLSVADLLLLQVRERRKEIGVLQAIGWRVSLVQRLFVQEGLLLAVLGALPGVLIALGVLAIQHQGQGVVPTPLIGLGTVTLMLIAAGLATIPAIHATNRGKLADVLRAEEA
jgi:cell division protein FtsX